MNLLKGAKLYLIRRNRRSPGLSAFDRQVEDYTRRVIIRLSRTRPLLSKLTGSRPFPFRLEQ